MNQGLKFCVYCGDEVAALDKYCGSCGSALVDHTPKERVVRKPFVFTANESDIKAYKFHIQYLENGSNTGNYILIFIFSSILCASLYALDFTGSSRLSSLLVGIFFGIVAPLFFLLIYVKKASVNRALYSKYKYIDRSLKYVYANLGSAQLRSGDVRCIFCGNNRLFKKGIYRSDTTTVNCTKCKAHLYSE
ncbi:hypothetical protein EC844_10836 [Acinetobacter calcoaceticus]|uniref:Uncharacterized protein n=1 Tax=Acinetobacter calcoaceticus TaxID=471 RepID=A0A4R1XW76_ACICA|nr:hypothetical protein EC844_10836 [Acinetobacter calcoaceticus]